MEMTLSRKVLNIAGILDYIAGGFTFLLGAVIAGAGVLAMNNPEFAQDMPTDLGVFTVLIIGIALAAGALLTMIYAHLERAAAKNPAKIMPVWVLSILSVLLNIGNLIHNLRRTHPLLRVAHGLHEVNQNLRIRPHISGSILLTGTPFRSLLCPHQKGHALHAPSGRTQQ